MHNSVGNNTSIFFLKCQLPATLTFKSAYTYFNFKLKKLEGMSIDGFTIWKRAKIKRIISKLYLSLLLQRYTTSNFEKNHN